MSCASASGLIFCAVGAVICPELTLKARPVWDVLAVRPEAADVTLNWVPYSSPASSPADDSFT